MRRTSFRPAANNLIGAPLDPRGDFGVGGTAVRRVVLEAAVFGRVVRRRHHDAVGIARVVPVVLENGKRHGRRRRELPLRRDAGLDPVRSEHLERGSRGRLGQRVRVDAHVERPVDPLRHAVVTDRLRRREDVFLVEAEAKRRPPVAGSAKAHAVARLLRIGLIVVVRGDELGDVDQDVRRRRLTSERMHVHRGICSSQARES